MPVIIITIAILVISAIVAEFTEKVNFHKAEVRKLYSRLERVSHSSRGASCLPNCTGCAEDQRIWDCERQYSYMPLPHQTKSFQELEEAYDQAYCQDSWEYLIWELKERLV